MAGRGQRKVAIRDPPGPTLKPQWSFLGLVPGKQQRVKGSITWPHIQKFPQRLYSKEGIPPLGKGGEGRNNARGSPWFMD